MNGNSTKKQLLKLCSRLFCFCISIFVNFFAHTTQRTYESHRHQNETRILQVADDFSEYQVDWEIILLGEEFILDSDFLKAGLEHSIKEFINRELACELDTAEDIESTSFYSVRILNNDVDKMNRKYTGRGKCKGNRTRCKKNIKKLASDAEKTDGYLKMLHLSSGMLKKDDICGTSIFDIFNDTLITASSFNYNVTFDVVDDFSGNLEVDLDVTFQESIGDGLNQIDFFEIVAEEPQEIFPNCDTRCQVQLREQRDKLMLIFNYFGIPYDVDLHECLFEGINCNDLDLVTHVWLGE